MQLIIGLLFFSGKSDILSGSPYKQALEEALTSKQVPKKKPKLLLKQTPTKKTKKPPQAPGKTGNKKKIWKCPACGEIYEEPPVEDWIECAKCDEWWHEACTSYDGQSDFICDLCQ